MSQAGFDDDWPEDGFYLLPLGGTGEIGMNLNLYGYQGKWLMIDLGVTFANDRLPGVDVIMPDPAFIEERRDDLVGIVLTHAHEDHIGAVPYLWPRFGCPLYATPFTTSLVRRKLAEAGLDGIAEVIEIPLSGTVELAPFQVELVTLTHSIPEPNAVVVRCAAGTVLHTGDWKIDPDPLVGETTDVARLKALAEEDVLAMVCDSTNALVEEDAGSEGEVREHLMEVVGSLENRVAIACFASNVARLETAIRVAQAHGRRVALVGRSLHRIMQAARENGYLTDIPPFIDETEVHYFPRNEVMLICTGSQGEPRAALWRIANGQHNHISLDPGDAVVFSSRVIPGNELGIFDLQNALVRRGLEVITDHDHDIHVSGHPGRAELAQMYHWVRPRIAIPVHGESRHLSAHASLAAECQVPQQIVAENGDLIQLAPGPARIADQVTAGRLAYEGNRLLPLESGVFRTRKKMSFNGAAFVTLVLDSNGRMDGDAEISILGLTELDQDEIDMARFESAVEEALSRLSRSARRDDDAVEEAASIAVRRTAARLWGKKPLTAVHVIRLE